LQVYDFENEREDADDRDLPVENDSDAEEDGGEDDEEENGSEEEEVAKPAKKAQTRFVLL
jgi:hypothetical protein